MKEPMEDTERSHAPQRTESEEMDMGIGARIYEDNGEFEVWIGPAQDLADDNIINAFVAGVGSTRDEAVGKAVAGLEALVEHLNSPPGVVAEKCLDVSEAQKEETGWRGSIGWIRG